MKESHNQKSPPHPVPESAQPQMFNFKCLHLKKLEICWRLDCQVTPTNANKTTYIKSLPVQIKKKISMRLV